MTKELVERLRGRHECGMNAHGYDLRLHHEAADTIERQAAQIAVLQEALARVKEECAAVCDQYAIKQKYFYPEDPSSWVSAQDCAEAIRAMGQK